jgi:3-isopropylmalate dehydrogenase
MALANSSTARLRKALVLPTRRQVSLSRRTHSIVCKAHKVAVLPGDGIGPEIMDAALKVLDAAGKAEGQTFEYTRALIGGAAIDATGSPLPKETLDICKSNDSVLLAAIGG